MSVVAQPGVVITGIGVVSPFGVGRERYWNHVSHGCSGISKITQFNVSEWPCQVAASVPPVTIEDALALEGDEEDGGRSDPKRYSRAALFGVIAGREAWADAGLRAGEAGAGVIIGTGGGGIDVALFSAFALHHSVFARLPVRAFVRRIVPSQLERSTYVWAASLMLIAVCFWWQPVPGVLWQVSSPWSWVMRGIQVAAVWLTLRSAAIIDGLELAGVRPLLTSGSEPPTPNAQSPEFKTDGPYGWVRHPIYLGWIVIVFSVGTMTMTRLVFATISSIYLIIAIPFEERTLRKQSPSYNDYARRVRWKLIPGVY